MTLLHRLASMVRWVVRRSQAERELNEELEAFVDMAVADEVRDGATLAEARRRAALQLGGVEQTKERVRGARHGAWLDAASRDVRYALRQLRRNPSFSAIAIATLALGIGGMTAMFSVFDAVLVRPLPYSEADRLVMIWDEMGRTDITSRHAATPRNGSSGGASIRCSPTSRVRNRPTRRCPATASPNRFPRAR